MRWRASISNYARKDRPGTSHPRCPGAVRQLPCARNGSHGRSDVAGGVSRRRSGARCRRRVGWSGAGTGGTPGAHVTVLDLTPTFVMQGRVDRRVGLSDLVDFEEGDGTAMPFADASFDGVWTQHSTMNIADKDALYTEIHRVLTPGGRLAMHEVMLGNGEAVDYPMPWASDPRYSFLRPAEEMRNLISAHGFGNWPGSMSHRRCSPSSTAAREARRASGAVRHSNRRER
ncbi:MAG: class I SAM-dependent methyltransferase [Thermomicrobiales bacterium]